MINKVIGDKCKQWRYNNGILQKDVARACKVSRITVWRFEEGLTHSTKLLDWYIKHGVKIDLSEVVKYE